MKTNRIKANLASILLLLVLMAIPLALRSQEAAPAPASGQVPLSVRVWSGDKFVSDLKLEDFELKVNGVPQPIDNLYFVDRSSVVRREGEEASLPITTRHFYLLFQLFEYHPKLAEAIRYFFNQGFLPGDSLSIQTPMRNYVLPASAIASKSRDDLAKEMNEIVRRDISEGAMAYKSILRELRRIVMSIGGSNPMAQTDVSEGGESMETMGLENLLTQYREPLARMDALRKIDEDKIVRFAQSLKNVAGQKIVFFIYQREFNPELAPQVLNALVDANQENQNVLSAIHELFQTYHRNISLNPDRIGQSFAGSSVDFNFLFIEKQPDRMSGIVMREQSEDIYKVFAATAQTTGGIVDSSQNPEAGVKDAMIASEKYYLLYFKPSPQNTSEPFNKLNVTVKGKGYKVLNRQGFSTN